MSYARSSEDDSDVYVIGTIHHLECFGAGWKLEQETPLHERTQAPDWAVIDDKLVQLDTTHEIAASFTTTSRTEMIAHLRRHEQVGHKVPLRAFARLRQEITQEGDAY